MLQQTLKGRRVAANGAIPLKSVGKTLALEQARDEFKWQDSQAAIVAPNLFSLLITALRARHTKQSTWRWF